MDLLLSHQLRDGEGIPHDRYWHSDIFANDGHGGGNSNRFSAAGSLAAAYKGGDYVVQITERRQKNEN